MIIQKIEKGFLVKIYKEYLEDFDFLDKDSIQDLFQKIVMKIQKRYELKGLLDIDVYVNEKFGLIIEIEEIYSYFEEIEEIYSYFEEIDMHIHFHLDSVFFTEIELENICENRDVYYYQGKFYGIYQDVIDSSILYKESEDIIEKGIKIY